MIFSIILGIPWQRRYKIVFDWETNSIKIKKMDGYVCQPFISPKAEIDNTKQIRLVLHKGKEVVSPTLVTKRPDKQATIISSTTRSTSNQKFVWKPRQTPLSTHQASTTKPFQCPPVSTTQRYVPKELLEAQCGCSQIWVPKQLHNKATDSPKLPPVQPKVTTKIPVQQTKQTKSITQKWVPESNSRVQKVSPTKTTVVWRIKSPNTPQVNTQPTNTNIDWHL